MLNIEHLASLHPRVMARVIINVQEDMCLCCPRERERRCNYDCETGLMEWLLSEYIPGSVVWKRRKNRNEKTKNTCGKHHP